MLNTIFLPTATALAPLGNEPFTHSEKHQVHSLLSLISFLTSQNEHFTTFLIQTFYLFVCSEADGWKQSKWVKENKQKIVKLKGHLSYIHQERPVILYTSPVFKSRKVSIDHNKLKKTNQKVSCKIWPITSTFPDSGALSYILIPGLSWNDQRHGITQWTESYLQAILRKHF